MSVAGVLLALLVHKLHHLQRKYEARLQLQSMGAISLVETRANVPQWVGMLIERRILSHDVKAVYWHDRHVGREEDLEGLGELATECGLLEMMYFEFPVTNHTTRELRGTQIKVLYFEGTNLTDNMVQDLFGVRGLEKVFCESVTAGLRERLRNERPGFCIYETSRLSPVAIASELPYPVGPLQGSAEPGQSPPPGIGTASGR